MRTTTINQLKTIFLLGSLSALIVGVGAALTPGAMYIALGIALLMNLGAYFFSDRLVLAAHGAREIAPAENPRLHALVDELARAAEIPTPRLYLIPSPQPNAFATGRNPQHGVVAVTEGILEALPERELGGVLAHEIAHIKNRDILVATIAAVLASVVTHLANVLSFSAFFGGSSSDEEEGGASSGASALAFAILAPLGATLVQLGISRSREYLADETGARLCGDAEALARALERLEELAAHVPQQEPQPATASLFIVNPLHAGRLAGLFSTHPPTEERCRRLRLLAEEARWDHRERVVPRSVSTTHA